QSETDLVSAVRRLGSEVPGSASRRSGSEADLRSHRSHRSRHSHSSSRSHGHRQELGMTLEEQQKSVNDAAFERYISSMQQDAKQAVVDGTTWKHTVKAGLDEDDNEKIRKKELCQKNQNLLQTQIQNNKFRRAETRKEFIEAASSHSFPLFTETYICVEEVEEYHKNQKALWREELNQQKKVNDMLRNLEIKKHKDAALESHKANVKSMTRGRKDERDRLADQGRDLVKNWERDIRLKDLKKAIESGKDVTTQLESPSNERRNR
ncbi:unnamed protein product, partial [Polarella glacialis]